MTQKNDITGDSLTTKVTNDLYRRGWDRIFGQKNTKTLDDYIKKVQVEENIAPLAQLEDAPASNTVKSGFDSQVGHQ